MSVRSIGYLCAAAILFLTIGAITAAGVMVVTGMTTALVAALLVSIKTDDPTRTMQEILVEDRIST